MTATTIAFFNNKGGVGKSSLVFHLASMFARMGLTVVAADFDPQANLTANFVDEEELELLWPGDNEDSATQAATIFGGVTPLIRATGDVADVDLRWIAPGLFLLPGDLALSSFEDDLSGQWPGCLDRKERAFRVASAFWRILARAAERATADLVLIDVGPNLGAINRSALIAADHVVIPLAPDLFSVRGLQNLGPSLRTWRQEWQERLPRSPAPGLALPTGHMRPAGYVLLQHGVRSGQPVQAYQRWMDRIPNIYRRAVLDVPDRMPSMAMDPHCLAQIKHYRSLMPMSYEVHKPVFDLKPADGAFGGHQAAVRAAWEDFEHLADRILEATARPEHPAASGEQER
jgi:chromosome partitioning protein